MFLTSAGLGMFLSSLAVQYRDISFIVTFLVQLLMYVAPVVWPVSLLSDKFDFPIRIYYGLYPMAGVIEGFRSALLGSSQMPYDLIIMGSVSATLIFIFGALYFKIKEPIFSDVL
jgi:lipopolysaccharide transport system permease protein